MSDYLLGTDVLGCLIPGVPIIGADPVFRVGDSVMSRTRSDMAVGKVMTVKDGKLWVAYPDGVSVSAALNFMPTDMSPTVRASGRLPMDAALKANMNTVIISSLVGGVLLGGAGALLWPAHRFAGLLLGSLLLGFPVGGMVGGVIAVNRGQR